MKRTSATLVCVSVFLLAARPASGDLTRADQLAAVYDTILAAQFDVAERRLAAACPPAPEEACRALHTANVWWQILMDPESRRLDAAIERAAAAAVEAAGAWTRREPRHAEAWFYLAAAHAPLVQWRALRDQHLSAAREGSRIKSALERALALDPTLHDAHFGIGMYRYYADVAPAAFRMLRWLLLLPGGNRTEGLKQMLEARQRGQLLQGEADYQLHFVYLWYEHDPPRALDLLRALDTRYPSNPLFLKRIAEVQRDYFRDRPASAAAWRRLAERARTGQVAERAIAEVNARLGLAIELDAMFETDKAIAEILEVLRTPPRQPHGAEARARLQLARAYDRLGHRAQAETEYRAVERDAPHDSYGGPLRDRARDGLSRRPDRAVADAYRLSLEGLRAVEEGVPAKGVALLARSTTANPLDPVARYRYAHALNASGDRTAARKQIEQVIAIAPSVPAVVRASVLAEYAAILEASGERARAIEMYRRASDVDGGSPHARDHARAALARLAS